MPKSVTEERIKANMLGATLELAPEDVAELDALDEYLVTGWDPVKDAPV
jgi:diketogulonate reductase-like aldo/keto reductase